MADDTFAAASPGVGREPEDPNAARAEIEMTRARMSETIDEIEDKLLRKKSQIQDRLDVLAPIRERPIPSAAAALGAGLLLGLLTGGGHDDEDRYEMALHAGDDEEFDEQLRQAEERAATWEARARRLMEVAREQEDELESLSGSGGRGWYGDGDEPDDDLPGDGSGLRDRIADGVTGFIGSMARDLFAPQQR